MIPGRDMANDAQGIRLRRTSGIRRDVLAVAVVGLGALLAALLLRPSAPPPPSVVERRQDPVPPRDPAAVVAPAPAPSEPAVAGLPRTRAGKLRALRRAGIAPERGPDGKPTLDAGPVIELLNKAGVHDGIAAFPPPGTNPPKVGVIVPDDVELPEGYVRHHQSTDDGEALPPILMFHPDYDFFDEQGQKIAIPPDRVVPPELVPPGLPIRMLALPARDRGR